MSEPSILDRDALAAERRTNAAARRLAPATLEIVRAAGMFDGLVPRELRGDDAVELHPVAWLATLEELAAGDPAAGWVAMTASTSTLLAPYLPPVLAREIWGEPALLAGVFAPSGKYETGRLVGRWAFASGCRHATWFALGALADGKHVVAIVPAKDVTIVDNWDTLGLGGTGSHDVTVDVAVPADRLATIFGATPWSTAPLYRVPLFGALAAGVAACAIGIARGALQLPLGKEPATAQLVGWAHARTRVAAARAYLHASIAAAFDAATVDGAIRGELRLAASHAALEAAEAVRALFRLAGGGAIRAGHPLELALRDVETALSHRMVADRVVPTAARALLGLGNPPPDL